jgi:LPS-assembly protein
MLWIQQLCHEQSVRNDHFLTNLQAYSSTSQERGMRLILALLATGVLAAAPAHGDENTNPPLILAEKAALPDAIEIEGDTLQLRMDRQLRATGNAIMRKNGQQVTGDDIRYDMQNDELQVEGNAVITAGSTKISGPMLRMRMSENIGEMRDVSIEFKSAPPQAPTNQDGSALLDDQAILVSDPKRYLQDNQLYSSKQKNTSFDNIRATAKQVLFEGQNTKRLKSASYTSCAADIDDWYIKTGSMELNDYTHTAEATNAYVEFKGVPILYTPWMSFSYSNQRKTGLLAPIWGTTSRSGFELLTPYYINIRPDMDATVATRFLSKRGMQLQGEFRYLDEDYSGVNNLEYLDRDSLTGQTRYYIKLAHQQRFSDNWSGGYKFEKVSDDTYFSELATRIQVTSRVNLQQTAFVNYDSDNITFNGAVERYQNLDNLSFVYQKLPQLTFSYNDEWKGFKTQTGAQYVYFDSMDGMGKVPTGSRLSFYPSVSYPMKNSYGFITPKVGIKTTQYSLNNNIPLGYSQEYNQINRTLPIVSLDSGLYFDKETRLFDTTYTHTLEPRAYYLYIPYRDQSKIPIFDTSLATLNQNSIFYENQFLGDDRVNNANQMTLALTSRLIDSETGIERLSATVGQRFYFDDLKVSLPTTTNVESKTSDILAGFTARLSSRLNLDTFWQYDPNNSNMQRNNYLLRYNPEPGKSFNFGYRYTANLVEQIDTSAQWPLGSRWYGVGRFNYSIRDDKAVQILAGLEYDAGCWQGRAVMQRVQTATADANYAMFFQLELGGLTSIGANPLNVIQRNIPTYMRTYDIPGIYRDQNAQ